MSNQEREAFEARIDTSKNPKFHAIRNELLLVFQAGASYQREQVKGLVEALELVLAEKAPIYHDCIDDGEQECAWCISRAALAAYRSAQEKSHD